MEIIEGPRQTSFFSCVELNVNERIPLFELICMSSTHEKSDVCPGADIKLKFSNSSDKFLYKIGVQHSSI